MENKRNAFQVHYDAIYSGKRKIHQTTDDNMPTTPPIKEEEKVSNPIIQEDIKKLDELWDQIGIEKPVFKEPKKRSRTIKALFALLVLVLLPTTLFYTHKEVEVLMDSNIEKVTNKIISGVYDMLPERVIQEKVKIVRVNETSQQAAIAKVKAWKELNDKLIHNHYNNKNLKGRRTLCLTLGNKEQCSIINTYTIRPELPPYLRRDLELK